MDEGIDPSDTEPDSDGIEPAEVCQPDIEVVRALEALWHPVSNPNPVPNRNDVESVLQQLADGKSFDGDYLFVRDLAVCLLAAGGRGTLAENRANNVLKACGLHGKYDEDRDAVRVMQTIRGFGGSVRNAINYARGEGALGPEVSDETAGKKLQPGRRR